MLGDKAVQTHCIQIGRKWRYNNKESLRVYGSNAAKTGSKSFVQLNDVVSKFTKQKLIREMAKRIIQSMPVTEVALYGQQQIGRAGRLNR